MIQKLAPPERLLCGPGPANVSQRVLEAMHAPILGHLDPDFRVIMDEVVQMLGDVYGRPGGAALPVSGTGHSGMEAGIANLLEPGDKAIVGVAGFFGGRIAELARRWGAEVIPVEAEWGTHVPPGALLDALAANPDAKLLATVHAETSTGMHQPLEELGAALAATPTLLMVDCVTSLGGVPLHLDRLGVDYAYSCSQKCLASPPGLAPVAISDKALARIEARRAPTSYYLDLGLLVTHWRQAGYYHHTTPILNVYALHESLRETLEEGLEARWARHADAGAYLQGELVARGFALYAEEGRRLPQLTSVVVPEGVDAKEAGARILVEHGIEIGGGLGPAAGKIWRIGLMGTNASRAVADRVLAALDDVVR
jgi:alanine-glyoxylate transaminase/serine-glyoxylate transaminase/serine-pyruvate transaminase